MLGHKETRPPQRYINVMLSSSAAVLQLVHSCPASPEGLCQVSLIVRLFALWWTCGRCIVDHYELGLTVIKEVKYQTVSSNIFKSVYMKYYYHPCGQSIRRHLYLRARGDHFKLMHQGKLDKADKIYNRNTASDCWIRSQSSFERWWN